MALDLATIVRQLQAVEARHPDTAADLEPIIKALTGEEAVTVGTEQAQKILGVRSANTVERWIELGILKGQRDPHSKRWQIPLDDILRVRTRHETLADIGGEELSRDKLDALMAARVGTYPWQRDERP